MNISWARLIKKFVGLDVLFASRTKKAGGVQDGRNTITEVITFTAPDTITFTTGVPAWMSLPGGEAKAIRVMDDLSPNFNKKYFVVAVTGPNSVQVVPANPPFDNMVNHSGLGRISGRIWEAVADEDVCKSDRYGNTIFNLGYRKSLANDGSGISLAPFDHYHPEITTSLFNAAGGPLVVYDQSSGRYVPLGPQVVVDNSGKVVTS